MQYDVYIKKSLGFSEFPSGLCNKGTNFFFPRVFTVEFFFLINPQDSLVDSRVNFYHCKREKENEGEGSHKTFKLRS